MPRVSRINSSIPNPAAGAADSSAFSLVPPDGSSPTVPSCWIGVASAAHVRQGRAWGIMQVNHGKAAPLRRVKPGDWIAYYSATVTYGGKDKLQAFTAIGVVKPGEPYQGDMGGGFKPFRRDVHWRAANEAPIAPLLNQLAFTQGPGNWGYQLRFGLFKISADDMALIARAMGVADAKIIMN